MSEFFEIDFLKVETAKSGDAISMRYQIFDQTIIHIVDGGFKDTGIELVDHIRTHYQNPTFIDHVVLTHGDQDHATGLRQVLEDFDIGVLWMLRPWAYAEELLPYFKHITSIDYLKRQLKEAYPYIAKLEEIAIRRNILILEPFQGVAIGAFTVLTPSKERFLNLVISSEKTPQEISSASMLQEALNKVASWVNIIRSAWGEEIFPEEETSNENEMSVVQYANICGEKIMLTGDTGRSGLAEAIKFAPYAGLQLPGIDRFQVPHHGSRRNISTELLDSLLGLRLHSQSSEPKFMAFISSAEADKDHPRKSVVRAMIHRGASVIATEGRTICTQKNAQQRDGWTGVAAAEYPEDQEDN